LERDAEATRQVLISALKRQKEIETQKTLQTADAQVIAYAAPPISPSSPKKLLTLGGALFAGLILGLLAALFRDTAALGR
jgi:succinoglycan biosynthesis transport protein ExoP